VLMYSGSKIIGSSKVCDNVILGADTTIINREIEKNKVVVGSFPNLKIINNERDDLERTFRQ